MELSTKFDIGNVVNIVPLKIIGKIEEINVDRSGVRYWVKYYLNSKCERSYFEEDERKGRFYPFYFPVLKQP